MPGRGTKVPQAMGHRQKARQKKKKNKEKTNQANHAGFSLRTFRHTFGMPAAHMAGTVKLFFLKIPICYMTFKKVYFLDDGR